MLLLGWVGVVVVVVVMVARASRVGFLRGGVCACARGNWLERVGVFCVTALAASDASLSVRGVFVSSGSGGASTKPAYALLMYQEFFHLVRSCALCTIWLNVRCFGTSINKLPGDSILN